jgi:hypothetical protein
MRAPGFLLLYSTPQKTDEIRTESLLAVRFQKFSVGRTSGEAALSAHNEEREAFRVWGCCMPNAKRSESGVLYSSSSEFICTRFRVWGC